jgi:hypothetical protein
VASGVARDDPYVVVKSEDTKTLRNYFVSFEEYIIPVRINFRV